MNRAAKSVLLPIMLMAAPLPMLQAQQVRTSLGDGYVAVYDTSAKRLTCKSQTPQRQWTANVAESVPTQGDWSGIATSAGPVFVYTSGSQVGYVLLRFSNGSTSSEGDGKSLRGPVAPGRLVVANWTAAQYGAKVTVVTLDGSQEHTTEMDINMWGTSKQLSRKTRAIQPKREQVPGSSLSLEIPPGFSAKWDASSKCMGIVPSVGIPVGMLVHATEGGVDLQEFASIFMRDIGPALGSSDMKQLGAQNVTVGGTMPGLLRIASGTRNGKQATFAFVFLTSPKNTVVMIYLAPSQSYDQYANLFYRLIASARLK